MAKSPIKVSTSYSVNREAIARVKAAMRTRAKHVAKHVVRVGITAKDGEKPIIKYTGEEGKATLAYVTLAHEYGAGVPQRSWFRSWFDRNAERNRKQMAQAMREQMKGNTQAVNLLAIRWAYELRAWISTGAARLAPLARSTQRQRQRMGLDPNRPLFAIGQIVDAIKAEVDGKVLM